MGANGGQKREVKWVGRMEVFFKACADQTRLRILHMLSKNKEVCVCDLVSVLKTNQPKVSRHLAYLKRAGLVQVRKEGLWVYYRISSGLPSHESQILLVFFSCCREVEELQNDLTQLETVIAGALRAPGTNTRKTSRFLRDGDGEAEGIELELL